MQACGKATLDAGWLYVYSTLLLLSCCSLPRASAYVSNPLKGFRGSTAFGAKIGNSVTVALYLASEPWVYSSNTTVAPADGLFIGQV